MSYQTETYRDFNLTEKQVHFTRPVITTCEYIKLVKGFSSHAPNQTRQHLAVFFIFAALKG